MLAPSVHPLLWLLGCALLRASTDSSVLAVTGQALSTSHRPDVQNRTSEPSVTPNTPTLPTPPTAPTASTAPTAPTTSTAPTASTTPADPIRTSVGQTTPDKASSITTKLLPPTTRGENTSGNGSTAASPTQETLLMLPKAKPPVVRDQTLPRDGASVPANPWAEEQPQDETKAFCDDWRKNCAAGSPCVSGQEPKRSESPTTSAAPGTSKPVTPTPKPSGSLPEPTPTDDKSPLTVAAFGVISFIVILIVVVIILVSVVSLRFKCNRSKDSEDKQKPGTSMVSESCSAGPSQKDSSITLISMKNINMNNSMSYPPSEKVL